jgi:hypothetical protein
VLDNILKLLNMKHVVILFMLYFNNVFCQSENLNTPTFFSNRSASNLTYSQSIIYCANLSELGYSDWRLPKIEEIELYIFNGGIIPAGGISTWTRNKFESSGGSSNFPNPGATYFSTGWIYNIDSSGNGEVRPWGLASGSGGNTHPCHCVR